MIDHFFKYEIKKNQEKIKTWCKDVCYANIPLIEIIFGMYDEYKTRLYSDYVEANLFIHPYIKIVILKPINSHSKSLLPLHRCRDPEFYCKKPTRCRTR